MNELNLPPPKFIRKRWIDLDDLLSEDFISEDFISEDLI